MVDNPITRKEKYLAKLTGSYTGNVPAPITRVEKYLYDLCQKGISGLTPEEIENAVNKYLKENPVQPGATEEQAQQIEQNKTDIASLKTETASLKEDFAEQLSKLSSIETIEIEGYEKNEYKDILSNGEFHNNQYVEKSTSATGYQITNAQGYYYYKIPVNKNRIVKVTGAYGYDIKTVMFINENDMLISYFPEERVTPIRKDTVTVSVPTGAKHVLVTGTSSIEVECKENGNMSFEKTNNDKVISVTIDNGKTLDVSIVSYVGNIIRHNIEVFNSAEQFNGAVLPRSVKVYMDDTWKTIVNNEDDNCPINLSSGYLGAGHGYGRARKLTVNSHGKTFSDIGSEWICGNDSAWLIRIVDENTLIFIGSNSTSNNYDTNSFIGTTFTHVRGAVHTGDIVASKNETFLITPVDKNHVKKIIIDGYKSVNKNGSYDANLFVDVIDEYDIINPQTIVTEILSNKPSDGYTENPPINTGDVFMHFSNIYRFLKDGTMLIITTIDNSCDVTLAYWGGTQYAQKSPSNAFGGKLYRYIPKVLPIDGRDFRTPFNMDSWNFTANLTTQYWEDGNNPPDRLLHLFTNASGSFVAGFAVGYLPIANGNGDIRKSKIDNAMFLYSSKKAYFHLVDDGGEDGKNWSAFIPFQSIVYRKPIFELSNKHTSAYFVPYGDKCYMYVDYHSICDDRIKIPSEYIGKQMKILEKSDNVTVYGTVTTDEVRVRVSTSSPMYGYAVVEIG